MGSYRAPGFLNEMLWNSPIVAGPLQIATLTPALGVLQDRGYRVALVTDGRMSGASGKAPAAIHGTSAILAAV